MPDKIEQELRYDTVVSGDRPSVVALGVFGAEALKKDRMAVFMVDVLGRVCLMPPTSVQVLQPPVVQEQELDGMTEDQAISVLVAQGSSDEEIVRYLKRRNSGETVDGRSRSL